MKQFDIHGIQTNDSKFSGPFFDGFKIEQLGIELHGAIEVSSGYYDIVDSFYDDHGCGSLFSFLVIMGGKPGLSIGKPQVYSGFSKPSAADRSVGRIEKNILEFTGFLMNQGQFQLGIIPDS
ncbi:hypothetical protein LEP1GSC047_1477 [Leptospira inadai serovar Lyme str. 10]|uniref:Uncharacterized protein n=1 Tax=Leptospira inadai serovar Lyme str. 10 TaxID=1049790 RepID=V6H9A2_9LEPT|nr:hypothetical protein LEP1GSC047_1477 [Leptospira inadai serovar Lyme str. 10]